MTRLRLHLDGSWFELAGSSNLEELADRLTHASEGRVLLDLEGGEQVAVHVNEGIDWVITES